MENKMVEIKKQKCTIFKSACNSKSSKALSWLLLICK